MEELIKLLSTPGGISLTWSTLFLLILLWVYKDRKAIALWFKNRAEHKLKVEEARQKAKTAEVEREREQRLADSDRNQDRLDAVIKEFREEQNLTRTELLVKVIKEQSVQDRELFRETHKRVIDQIEVYVRSMRHNAGLTKQLVDHLKEEHDRTSSID